MRWVDGPILDPIDRLAIENGVSGRALIRQRLRQRAGRVPPPELLAWSREQAGILAYQQAKAAEALRERRTGQRRPVPPVTEFGRAAREVPPDWDPAFRDLAGIAGVCCLLCLVIYVLVRVLP